MLDKISSFIANNLFNIPDNSHLSDALNFFIADVIKILLLLLVIIFIVSFIRTYLPPAKIKNILSQKHGFIGNILAALLGIITPFCTCSAIPLFLGFLEAGVPLGVTFSFLVASPMINEIAVVLLFGTFGWKIAFLYILSGLIIAIISGLVIGGLKVENLIEKDIAKNKITDQFASMTFAKRLIYSKNYTLNIIRKIWPYLLIGIGLGAFMHGYVPADFLGQYLGKSSWYSVPLAALIGIPLYSNAAGAVPIVAVLTEKGVSIGTSLAFMMAVVGLSLPEFMILKRIMKPKLILIFAGIVGLGIILTGYLFNWII